MPRHDGREEEEEEKKKKMKEKKKKRRMEILIERREPEEPDKYVRAIPGKNLDLRRLEKELV